MHGFDLPKLPGKAFNFLLEFRLFLPFPHRSISELILQLAKEILLMQLSLADFAFKLGYLFL